MLHCTFYTWTVFGRQQQPLMGFQDKCSVGRYFESMILSVFNYFVSAVVKPSSIIQCNPWHHCSYYLSHKLFYKRHYKSQVHQIITECEWSKWSLMVLNWRELLWCGSTIYLSFSEHVSSLLYSHLGNIRRLKRRIHFCFPKLVKEEHTCCWKKNKF